MSEIRVDKIINEVGTGPVELTQGATLPIGKSISGSGDLNISGVSTFQNNIIQTSGLVGIGTDNPLQRFQIGTANTLGVSTDGKVFVVTSNADVGIGTTNPTSKLHVVGDINFTGTFYQGGTQFIASRWSATGSDIYRLSKVGINTSIVSSALTVNGDVYVSGVVTATTFIGAVTGTATSTTNIPNLTGDITSANTATTLATVNSNVGTFGNGTSIPTITVNAKGLITGVTTTAVTSGTTITDDTSTNATRYLPFTSATSGSISAANVSSTKLTFNPSTGTLSATDFNSTSDISLKDNIQTIVNPLDKIIKLNGVTFNWKENQKPSIGVIAQELEKVLPELVTQGEVKSVNYNGIIGVLIEAIKELKKEIEDLKETK